MKKTIFIVLLLTGLFQHQHSYAQTQTAERKKTSRIRIASIYEDCIRGLALCITIGPLSNRDVFFGIERINGKEQLCLYKEGMSDAVQQELNEVREFPVERDLLLDERTTSSLGIEGEILLVKGKYSCTEMEDRYVIPIRIIHQ